MASHPVKLLICAVAVAFLQASHAEAATKSRKPVPGANAANSQGCRGGNLFPCGPVYNGKDYLGYDPDPFIRSQIQRDLGLKYGDPD